MGSLDFREIKSSVSIETIVNSLPDLKLKRVSKNQYRGPCPLGHGDDRTFTVTTDYVNKDGSIGAFKCFGKGCPKPYGDLIELVAKVEKISVKEAAIEIKKAFAVRTGAQLPESGLPYLEPAHEAVAALGISEEHAKRIGAGYAGRGTMIGRVCLALRDEKGAIQAYAGFAPHLDPPLKVGKFR